MENNYLRSFRTHMEFLLIFGLDWGLFFLLKVSFIFRSICFFPMIYIRVNFSVTSVLILLFLQSFPIPAHLQKKIPLLPPKSQSRIYVCCIICSLTVVSFPCRCPPMCMCSLLIVENTLQHCTNDRCLRSRDTS